mmetsp:Transcript_2452/g.7170  ORF Transcript_2452/g.7170 Transcript_2452/m.7170 type:complete len:223 (-) Transcript_2452:448-1116(-)
MGSLHDRLVDVSWHSWKGARWEEGLLHLFLHLHLHLLLLLLLLPHVSVRVAVVLELLQVLMLQPLLMVVIDVGWVGHGAPSGPEPCRRGRVRIGSVWDPGGPRGWSLSWWCRLSRPLLGLEFPKCLCQRRHLFGSAVCRTDLCFPALAASNAVTPIQQALFQSHRGPGRRRRFGPTCGRGGPWALGFGAVALGPVGTSFSARGCRALDRWMMALSWERTRHP